jgi:D-alanyl-lipoteichoic acid acyltransferase DltB (MBOAT superfamily)
MPMKDRSREGLVRGAGLLFMASLLMRHWLGYKYHWLIWVRDASWAMMMLGLWFTYRDKANIPQTPNQTLGIHAFLVVFLGAAIFYDRESWVALIFLVPMFLYVVYRLVFLFREWQRPRRTDTPAPQALS